MRTDARTPQRDGFLPPAISSKAFVDTEKFVCKITRIVFFRRTNLYAKPKISCRNVDSSDRHTRSRLFIVCGSRS